MISNYYGGGYGNDAGDCILIFEVLIIHMMSHLRRGLELVIK